MYSCFIKKPSLHILALTQEKEDLQTLTTPVQVREVDCFLLLNPASCHRRGELGGAVNTRKG